MVNEWTSGRANANQIKCTNRFLYSDNVWCVIPIRKESLERHWFHAGIHHVHTVGDALTTLWGIKRKPMRDLLHNYLNTDNCGPKRGPQP